jgi:hypothetical protein
MGDRFKKLFEKLGKQFDLGSVTGFSHKKVGLKGGGLYFDVPAGPRFHIRLSESLAHWNQTVVYQELTERPPWKNIHTMTSTTNRTTDWESGSATAGMRVCLMSSVQGGVGAIGALVNIVQFQKGFFYEFGFDDVGSGPRVTFVGGPLTFPLYSEYTNFDRNPDEDYNDAVIELVFQSQNAIPAHRNEGSFNKLIKMSAER